MNDDEGIEDIERGPAQEEKTQKRSCASRGTSEKYEVVHLQLPRGRFFIENHGNQPVNHLHR